MNVTLDYLKSNRKWLVRDFRVWGNTGSTVADMIVTEYDSSGARVVYLREYSGGNEQIVNFADLIDHRGNQLPANIVNAAILLIPGNRVKTFLRGASGSTSFRIARDGSESEEGLVDLMIMEMN